MNEMSGRVDEYGRALVMVRLFGPTEGDSISREAWVDTAFTGELLVSPDLCAQLNLRRIGTTPVLQSDGIAQQRHRYECEVEWLGGRRLVTVISGTTRLPLVGVHLLEDSILTIDYSRDTVLLTLPPAPREA
jgi:clan AA aspartic protease